MPIFDVDVQKLTAAGTTASDYLAALQTALGAGSKFSVEGSDANGFWIAPAADKDWQLALRDDTGDIQAAIDPLGDFTGSGAVVDTSEWSGMQTAVTFGATRSADFYLVELPDALMVLWMNSAETELAEAIMLGELWYPVDWQIPVAHLGMLLEDITNTGWLDVSSSPNWAYVGGTVGWLGLDVQSPPSQRYWIDGARVPFRYGADLVDIDGATGDADGAVRLKYLFASPEGATRPIGDFEDNGD